jgi:hypothetical protein
MKENNCKAGCQEVSFNINPLPDEHTNFIGIDVARNLVKIYEM